MARLQKYKQNELYRYLEDPKYAQFLNLLFKEKITMDKALQKYKSKHKNGLKGKSIFYDIKIDFDQKGYFDYYGQDIITNKKTSKRKKGRSSGILRLNLNPFFDYYIKSKGKKLDKRTKRLLDLLFEYPQFRNINIIYYLFDYIEKIINNLLINRWLKNPVLFKETFVIPHGSDYLRHFWIFKNPAIEVSKQDFIKYFPYDPMVYDPIKFDFKPPKKEIEELYKTIKKISLISIIEYFLKNDYNNNLDYIKDREFIVKNFNELLDKNKEDIEKTLDINKKFDSEFKKELYIQLLLKRHDIEIIKIIRLFNEQLCYLLLICLGNKINERGEDIETKKYYLICIEATGFWDKDMIDKISKSIDEERNELTKR